MASRRQRQGAIERALCARRPRRARRRVRRHRHEPALHAEDRARLHRARIPIRRPMLGALSLILWTLFLITTVKYVNFAMRVDNDGEGGIIALMTLLGVKKHQRPIIVAVGLFGAALIYGDGAITPAISVLSALEGVEQIAPSLADLRAAGGGRRPARAVRRAAVRHGGDRPRLRPDHAGVVRRHRRARRLRDRPASAASSSAIDPRLRPRLPDRAAADQGFLVLGGVFLCVTGAEALYADMGHFGPGPIRLSWYARRVPGPHPQLRRAGGDRARRRADRGQHLLPALPGAAADAADRAGDGRDGDRQPVDHHRRLFDDPPGDPARLAAAHDHQADLGGGLRPDLCRHGQLAPDDRHARR